MNPSAYPPDGATVARIACWMALLGSLWAAGLNWLTLLWSCRSDSVLNGIGRDEGSSVSRFSANGGCGYTLKEPGPDGLTSTIEAPQNFLPVFLLMVLLCVALLFLLPIRRRDRAESPAG